MHECLVHEMLNDLADDSTVDVIKLDHDKGVLSGQVEYESYTGHHYCPPWLAIQLCPQHCSNSTLKVCNRYHHTTPPLPSLTVMPQSFSSLLLFIISVSDIQLLVQRMHFLT